MKLIHEKGFCHTQRNLMKDELTALKLRYLMVEEEIKKTALGAENTVSWKKFDTAATAIEELRSMNYKVFAVEQATNSLSLEKITFAADAKIALVFGNEVSGVEQDTIHLCDGCIEIPQLGMKHSLNIATAAGVVIWELVRVRIQQHLPIQ